MPFQISCFSDEYSTPFSEQISGVKKLGINFIELRFVDGVNIADITKEKFTQIKSMLEKNDVRVSSIGSPIGKISLSDDFEIHLQTAEKIFFFAQELGCSYVRIFSFYLNNDPRADCKNMVIERIAKLIYLAEKYNITLCLENEEKLYGESPENCLELVKYFNGKLKLAFDMGNFRLCGYEPYDAYKKLVKYIAYFHIKDALGKGEIVPCGEGEADIKRIIEDFYKLNHNKRIFLSLEPHLVDFVGLDALATHKLKHERIFASSQDAFAYSFNNLQNIVKKIKNND